MSYDLRITGERVEALLHDVSTGKNALPIFQRGYVWDRKGVIRLADSLLKGIPLGNIFLWDTRQELHTIDYSHVGVEQSQHLSFQRYIIDGGQRSMTIYGLAHGCKINKVDFDGLYIDGRGYKQDLVDGDVSVYTLSDIQKLDSDNLRWYVPIKYYFWKSINSSELDQFRQNRSDYDESSYLDRYYFMQDEFHRYLSEQDLTTDECTEILRSFTQISHGILSREVSVTSITDGNLQDVLSLFERTNQDGVKLQEVEILNAVLYNKETGFYYTDELERLANEILEDTGMELRSRGKNPYQYMNDLVKYMAFGTYNNAQVFKGQQLFDPVIIKSRWLDITRAIYNASEEVGYNKNTDLKLTYRDIPVMLWASFFYHNDNEEQTQYQQESIEQFIKRLFGTFYFENGGRPQRLRTLSQYMEQVAQNKDQVTVLTPELIEGTSSAYLTVSEVLREADKAKKPNDQFNRRFFYMQEVRGNVDLFTGERLEGVSSDLEICHIFPKNTHGEVSNNVFNFIRQPKTVNNEMGHGEPLSWINKVSSDVLAQLFIDGDCIRHIRNGDINSFIQRRAELFQQYYIS